MKTTSVFASLVVVVFSLLISIPSQASTQLTYRDFGSLPDVAQIGLSPNGNHIFSKIRIAAENVSGTAIEVMDLTTKEKKIVLFTDNEKYDINWIRWKNNHILLVGLIYPTKRSIPNSGRKYKIRESRLMIINTKTDQTSMAFTNFFLKDFYIQPVRQDNVIDILPDDDDHILISLRTNRAMFDPLTVGVYKLNIHNQQARIIEKGKQDVHYWRTDRQHNVRILNQFKKGVHHIKVKDIDSGEWQTLWEWENFSDDRVSPLGFGKDPNTLFVNAYHNDRLAIFKVNLKDPNLKLELVFANDNYDVSGWLIYSPENHEVIGIAYSESDYQGYHFFDNVYKQLQTKLNKTLPDTNNRITSISSDGQSYLLFANSDVDSGTYYLGKRNPASLQALAYRYKKLAPELMAPVKSYNYKARDGLEIEGFLTLPKNKTAKKLPTIIFPHGGPIAKETKSFDYWAQYLANKGYAVLQMNFRGSYGLGFKFMQAGLKNWGQQMQDDVQDGAKQLIADGISDTNKICILGASYGGYAALMGAVKTPDFYQCAVSVAGVSNVVDLVRDNRRFWESYNAVDEQIGNNWDHLRKISPVNHAEKIKVPVLLVHGDSDRQVDIKHSEQMRKALDKASKSVTFLELENEDHYLTDNNNRVKAFAAIDEFLSTYLPVE